MEKQARDKNATPSLVHRSRTPTLGGSKNGAPGSSQDRTFRQVVAKDPTEVYNDKLKHLNSRLRRLLKDLNEKVEFAIDRFNTKKLANLRKANEPDLDKMRSVKDRELNNAQQQLEAYQQEYLKLESRLNAVGGHQIVLQMEQDVREDEIEIDKLDKRIRAIEKVSADQGNELERANKDDDPSTHVRGLMEEVRVWKEKNRAADIVRMKDRETQAAQEEHVKKLEGENRVLENEVSELLKQKHWDSESIRKSVAQLTEKEGARTAGN